MDQLHRIARVFACLIKIEEVSPAAIARAVESACGMMVGDHAAISGDPDAPMRRAFVFEQAKRLEGTSPPATDLTNEPGYMVARYLLGREITGVDHSRWADGTLQLMLNDDTAMTIHAVGHRLKIEFIDRDLSS